VDVKASVFSRAFFEEARTLWFEEQLVDSAITASASQILSIACILNGEEALGNQLFKDGRQMAERMRLFGAKHSLDLAESFSLLSPEWRSFTTYSAWAVYSYQT
jgi:hypothetical protein